MTRSDYCPLVNNVLEDDQNNLATLRQQLRYAHLTDSADVHSQAYAPEGQLAAAAAHPSYESPDGGSNPNVIFASYHFSRTMTVEDTRQLTIYQQPDGSFIVTWRAQAFTEERVEYREYIRG